ncbi:hypothetical protein [Streptomyces sp. NBC_00572]|uniref:hypothetical protein n=1 Tax=Streptomyces sp. NBC_00572 TaxID=2903664 RepID=UPI00224E6A5C|nr:hypothetical protein [Streptomyces sp. NBC_00572]MCX4981494.1 hypothetical protein [Streptomyces sp. NBC_00572]
MLNRIRRAIARTRERYSQKPRHRDALKPTRQTLIHPNPSDALTLLLRQFRGGTDFFPGEETALVRPYVLASEQRARQRSAPVPHHILAHTCFTPAEVHG